MSNIKYNLKDGTGFYERVEERFACIKCEKTFASKVQRGQHMRYHHKEEE